MNGTNRAPSAPKSSDVGIRTLSGIVLAPIVMLIVWLGGPAFFGLVVLAALLMGWEWTRLINDGKNDAVALALYAVCSLCALAAAVSGNEIVAVAITAGGMAAAFVLSLVRRHAHPILSGFGVAYVTLPALALYVLRAEAQYGLWCVVWLLLVIWGTDTGAYFTGRTLKGPKVAPALSPNKTWSGVVGGLICAFAVGIGVAYFLELPSALALGFVSVFISVVGQAGDFFESGLKRRFGVKDTSNLIPGHGGILDRLDSLICASVAAWAIGTLMAGEGHATTGVLVW